MMARVLRDHPRWKYRAFEEDLMSPARARTVTTCGTVVTLGLLIALPAAADPFFFSTGNPDGLMATATRPALAGKFEIESADDFAITSPTSITSATFTGLVTTTTPGTTPTIGQVVVEIYEVFPNLSDVGRTSGPPTFSTPEVPT